MTVTLAALAARHAKKKSYVLPRYDKSTRYDINPTDTQFVIHQKGSGRVIAFEGSDGKEDWKRNFRFGKFVVPYSNTSSPIRVHEGWIESYFYIRSIIHDEILDGKVTSILVTGFSLGAALSTLAAIDINYNFRSIILKLINFGSPRVGNSAFKKSFNKRLPNSIRYVFRNDLVTRIPYCFFGYRHVGNLINLGTRRFLPWGRVTDHNMRLYLASLS